MTQNERKELRETKVEDYYRMKLQWRTLSVDQESRFAAYKQRKDLIGKMVICVWSCDTEQRLWF